jgi:hypothetical protein
MCVEATVYMCLGGTKKYVCRGNGELYVLRRLKDMSIQRGGDMCALRIKRTKNHEQHLLQHKFRKSTQSL